MDIKDYEGMSIQELAKIQQGLIFERDELKAKTSDLTKNIDLLRNLVIPDKMEDEGINRISIEGVGTVSLHPVTQVSVRKGMQQSLQDWLKTEDAGDLIKLNVNASTLKAYINERITKGEEYPDSIINFNAFVQARIMSKA